MAPGRWIRAVGYHESVAGTIDRHMLDAIVPARPVRRLREVGPHVVEEDGKEYWAYEDKRAPTLGINAVAGKPCSE